MIFLKIARVLSNPKTKDSWDDIAGYAKLVADRCEVPGSRAYRENCQQEPPNGAEVLERNKLPCYCNGGACMMEHGGRLKYVYCKKAENADKKVPRYSNETSNREPAEV